VAPKIEAIELARYRGFREEQRVALARLSLVYGENNSGKSALVRVPPLLAGSRTVGRPGLDLDLPVLRGAGFRELAWRGPLANEQDRDMVLGIRLSTGATWRWIFRWRDLQSIAVIQHLEFSQGTEQSKVAFELRDLVGQYPRDAEYDGPAGRVKLVFDGLIPREGTGTPIDQRRDELSAALDEVTWLGALRRGPPREGSPRGAQGSLTADGEGAAALALADSKLRQAVSEWFVKHTGYSVELESLGSEMQRLVLRPTDARHDVAFPDAGEGLQQVFPIVVAMERLRRDGGLLSVEEPESHLHPRLQRALAELTVSVLNAQPAASVLLETHSEVFLTAALSAAASSLSNQVRLYWTEAEEDGAITVDEIALDETGRPTSPRLEQAFDTMGVMRRELLEVRRALAAEQSSREH
jgi:AAA domain, putative AbiEii toxin, Type IV TA system